ncbi:MAG: TROVE domain-containing protein [Acidimicrobiia bacterium]
MSKFARIYRRPAVKSVVNTKGVATHRTYEGARALKRDYKSELFLLAITNMVAEDTFYEMGNKRDDRFVKLIRKATRKDPDWVRRFVPWLRNEANMRSASIVMAAEYVAAGGERGRAVVNSAIARADEPAEMLAYWTGVHGRRIPQPLKRGVADAVSRLYTEYTAMKYDGLSRAWRMGDVIELVHPKPRDQAQSDLFRYLLDRRHHPGEMTVSEALTKVTRRHELESLTPAHRREALRGDTAVLDESGATWEWMAGWVPNGMDAEAWEAVIPSMGYMALLRNLRNFDEADISVEMARYVEDRLTDADGVARSRQFPFRFYSAYKNVPSIRWAPTLETALDLSVRNVPRFAGRTLILTDTSGSMMMPVSRRSSIQHFEIAAVFAASAAKTADSVDLISFASASEKIRFRKNESVLRTVQRVGDRIGKVGHGTLLGEAIRRNYNGHDRVIVFSDMQTADQVPSLGDAKVYVFNTGGYRATPVKVGSHGRYELGGFSDATFRLMKVLENYQDADWPF